jgi:hypothetical protein
MAAFSGAFIHHVNLRFDKEILDFTISQFYNLSPHSVLLQWSQQRFSTGCLNPIHFIDYDNCFLEKKENLKKANSF